MKIKQPFLVFLLAILIGTSCSKKPVLIPKDPQLKKAIEQLKDKNASVRISAIYALEQLQAKEYANYIAELLKDKTITKSIDNSNKYLDPWITPDYIDRYVYTETVYLHALNALVKLQTKECVNDWNEEVRKAAEEVLKKWGVEVERKK